MSERADSAVPTLVEVVARHCRDRPARVALRDQERVLTWRDLAQRGDALARWLRAQGVPSGARVAHLGHNSAAVAVLFHACARADLLCVPINWRLARAEVDAILADCGATMLFAGEGFGTDRPVRTLPESVIHDPGGGGDEADLSAPRPEDTAALIYTSGTTGAPKGVMLSHRSLFATSALRKRNAQAWDRWSCEDVTLAPLPLGHAGGLGVLMRSLYFGGETVILPTFAPQSALRAIDRHAVTKLALVPTAIRMLIDHPDFEKTDFSGIGTIVYGAAPITPELLREAMERIGCEFAQSYGMTETFGTCIVLPPADHDPAGSDRILTAGKPLAGTQVRIIDENGSDVPTGQTGEIAIRSIAAMSGYWNRPEETAAVLDSDGWYRTGDAGLLDRDGYVRVLGRRQEMIICGGENVYPAEVENRLAEHPAIADAAAFGLPDPKWGEVVAAAVVVRSAAAFDPAQVTAWAGQGLARYKTPRAIFAVDSLPLNASGKVQKHVLRERFANEPVYESYRRE